MSRVFNLLFVLMLTLTLKVPVRADEVLPASMKQVLKHSTDVPGLLHIVLSTMFMVIFIYVIAIIYHKLSKFNNKKFSGLDDKILNLNKLKLVNSMSIGPNKSLHVVEINNKFLVIGSSQTSINLLKEFDKNAVMFGKEEFKSSSEIEKIVEDDNEQQESLEQEINALRSVKPSSSAELDFEKIYKKYI